MPRLDVYSDVICPWCYIGKRHMQVALAVQAGFARAAAVDFLASDRLAESVQAEDQAVRQAGLSGVPTFVLDRHVLFSGAVPADVFAEALGKADRALAGRAA